MPVIIDDIDELKSNSSAIHCFTSRLRFTKIATNKYRTNCPFHSDSTPSFDVYVYQNVWIYKCLGCGVTGNVIQFVERLDNISFTAAINTVREEVGGYKPTFISPPEPDKLRTFVTLPVTTYSILEQKLAANQAAQDWLLNERGITYTTAKKLRMGYRQTIETPMKELQDVLSKGWISFPCIEGDLVVSLKYRSIHRKAFYRKPGMMNALFNTQSIEWFGDLYITEGEFDCAALEQAGFSAVSIPNATTAITPKMIDQMRQADRIILAGDDDDLVGTKKMKELQTQLSGSLFLHWRGAKDANQLALQHRDDPASFKELVAELTEEAAKTAVASTVKVIAPALAPVADADVTVADMPDSVLDGRLGEICQKRLPDFPLAYSWAALVTCAGTLVPQSNNEENVFGIDEPQKRSNTLRSNLYFCSVGAQGSGKSQAIEQALTCLGMWPKHDRMVNAKFGSAEGMLSFLEGAGGGKRVVFLDELGHLLEKSNIEGSCFPYVLNTAYYNDAFTVTMAKNKLVDFNCCLSLAGGVVEDMFGELFGSKTTGGMHGRFIFGLGPKPHTYLYRPYEGITETVTPCAIEIDKEIWDARDQWVKNNTGLTGRMAEHALRVAAICASVDGRKLRAKDLGPALEFALYQVRAHGVLEPNPGRNPDAQCSFKITSWLLSNASDGRAVERRALYRAIHGYRYGPGVYDRALMNLSFNREIRQAEIDKKMTVRLDSSNVVPDPVSFGATNRAKQPLMAPASRALQRKTN